MSDEVDQSCSYERRTSQFGVVWATKLINLGSISDEIDSFWTCEHLNLINLGLMIDGLYQFLTCGRRILWLLCLRGTNLIYLGPVSIELDQFGTFERRSWSILDLRATNLSILGPVTNEFEFNQFLVYRSELGNFGPVSAELDQLRFHQCLTYGRRILWMLCL